MIRFSHEANSWMRQYWNPHTEKFEEFAISPIVARMLADKGFTISLH
jgi:hypothetical protein